LDQVRAATGWDLKVSDALGVTAAPSPEELCVLRDLEARTAAAHKGE
jgi:glutaconate CoA-transferase subunit B